MIMYSTDDVVVMIVAVVVIVCCRRRRRTFIVAVLDDWTDYSGLNLFIAFQNARIVELQNVEVAYF